MSLTLLAVKQLHTLRDMFSRGGCGIPTVGFGPYSALSLGGGGLYSHKPHEVNELQVFHYGIPFVPGFNHCFPQEMARHLAYARDRVCRHDPRRYPEQVLHDASPPEVVEQVADNSGL